MLLKLSIAMFMLGGACVVFLMALFAGVGIPAWVVALYRVVFSFFWVPFVTGGVLLLLHSIHSRNQNR